MSKTIVVIPDQHDEPEASKERADWLGKYIKEERPDVVINLGDAWDMGSLSSYDKGKAAFYGSSYNKDIISGLEFQERIWEPVRQAKKKQPYKIFLIGNHEERINKVLQFEHHLQGDKYGISINDLDLRRHYHDIIPYNGTTPGIFTFEGVNFAHYFVSGAMGRPISGDNHARNLLNKLHASCVCGHSHTIDFSATSTPSGKKLFSAVAGIYKDKQSGWAGNSERNWWRGVLTLRNVETGSFDPEFISLKALAREYGI